MIEFSLGFDGFLFRIFRNRVSLGSSLILFSLDSSVIWPSLDFSVIGSSLGSLLTSPSLSPQALLQGPLLVHQSSFSSMPLSFYQN